MINLKHLKHFNVNLPKKPLKLWKELANSRFNYKERYIFLTVHKLSEDDYGQNWLKCYNKMNPLIRMITIYNIKIHYVVRLKFGVKFSASLTKIMLEAKARICSTIKENLSFYSITFLAFVVIVISCFGKPKVFLKINPFAVIFLRISFGFLGIDLQGLLRILGTRFLTSNFQWLFV